LPVVWWRGWWIEMLWCGVVERLVDWDVGCCGVVEMLVDGVGCD